MRSGLLSVSRTLQTQINLSAMKVLTTRCQQINISDFFSNFQESAQRQSLLSSLQEERERLQASHSEQLEKLRLQFDKQIEQMKLEHSLKVRPE